MRNSLGKIDLSIAFKTSWKAITYMNTYMNDSFESQLLIEKFVKLHKCHCNILDQECEFLDQLRLEIENAQFSVWSNQYVVLNLRTRLPYNSTSGLVRSNLLSTMMLLREEPPPMFFDPGGFPNTASSPSSQIKSTKEQTK